MVSSFDDCTKSCREFKVADFTFMASFGQSKYNAVGQWWDAAISSITCASLLEHCKKADVFRSVTMQNESSDTSHSVNLVEVKHSRSGCLRLSLRDGLSGVVEYSNSAKGDKEPLKDDIRRIFALLEKQTKPQEESEGFVWTKRQLSRLYHPDTSVQSLEDTPLIFELKQARDVFIRSNISQYLEMNGVYGPPDWTLQNIKEKILAHTLLYMSYFDLALRTNDDDGPEIGIASSIQGYGDKAFWKARTDLYSMAVSRTIAKS